MWSYLEIELLKHVPVLVFSSVCGLVKVTLFGKIHQITDAIVQYRNEVRAEREFLTRGYT